VTGAGFISDSVVLQLDPVSLWTFCIKEAVLELLTTSTQLRLVRQVRTALLIVMVHFWQESKHYSVDWVNGYKNCILARSLPGVVHGKRVLTG